MKKISFMVLAIALFVTTHVLVVYASEGAGHEGGIDNKFIFSAINFILLVVGMFFLLKRPTREFFANRHHTIRLSSDSAKKMRDEAYSQYKEVEARLKGVDTESQKLVNTVKEQAEKEKQHIIAQAEDMAQKIRDDTHRIADQELLKAKKALKIEAVQLAANLAAQKIEKQISADDHLRLGNEFVTQVKKAGVL
ncbi:MAG: ATP synthase F0 subunit B [Deltaproteobacteria bacterium]|nr:ATP synthase F0 subunit B [Deltaproteobacteria bacterium]